MVLHAYSGPCYIIVPCSFDALQSCQELFGCFVVKELCTVRGQTETGE